MCTQVPDGISENNPLTHPHRPVHNPPDRDKGRQGEGPFELVLGWLCGQLTTASQAKPLPTHSPLPLCYPTQGLGLRMGKKRK